MTKLQKQFVGNNKAPELAATKLTKLPVTLGIAPEDTGETIAINTGVHQGWCARNGSDPPRVERFRQIAGQSRRLIQPLQEPPHREGENSQ
jgi:hypothetical protein